MQSIRNSILSHIRLRGSAEQFLFAQRGNEFKQLHRQMCTSVGTSPDKIMDRVIGLVKKFDKIDATKVTN
jgi:NADH dehydrogenase (ubiquinone) 1 alpha/beta subcomplex 1